MHDPSAPVKITFTSVRNDLQVVSAVERKVVNAEDKDLKSAVQRRIKQDTRLKGADIDVRVDAGVVTLTGDVKDLGARARASEVARSVCVPAWLWSALHGAERGAKWAHLIQFAI